MRAVVVKSWRPETGVLGRRRVRGVHSKLRDKILGPVEVAVVSSANEGRLQFIQLLDVSCFFSSGS